MTTHMNDYRGKRFLATVRNGDYAHAGEEESIQLAFAGLDEDPTRLILDMGCGRGGTAFYIQSRAFGKVTGIDIEEASILEAKLSYPSVEFLVSDVAEIGKKFPAHFDLVYLFNVFYAFPDTNLGMANLRQVAKDGAKLLLFDYLAYKPELYPAEMLAFSPPTDEQFSDLFKKNSWRVDEAVNLDRKYVDWYARFLERFDRPEVRENFDAEYIESARQKYLALYKVHESGIFGGRLFKCTAV